MKTTPSVRQELTNILKEERAGWSSEPKEYFRMSSFGMCPKKQIAKRAGIPETRTANIAGLFKMKIGQELHTVFQDMLEKSGATDPEWRERQVRYKSYVGHVDGKILLPTRGNTILELKTTDDSALKWDWPVHYLWQGLIYCLAAGFEQTLFVQIGKNQGLTRERVVPLTDVWKRKIITEVNRMERMWAFYEKTGKLPKCRHRFGWEDKLCSYIGLDPAPASAKNYIGPTQQREQGLAHDLDQMEEGFKK